MSTERKQQKKIKEEGEEDETNSTPTWNSCEAARRCASVVAILEQFLEQGLDGGMPQIPEMNVQRSARATGFIGFPIFT